MGFGREEVSLIKVLTDLGKVEHTSSIDMQVLADLKRGLWPHRCISHSVLMDLRQGEHTAAIDMQVLTDLLQYFRCAFVLNCLSIGRQQSVLRSASVGRGPGTR